MRHPLTLRDLMILPVRTGYIGADPLTCDIKAFAEKLRAAGSEAALLVREDMPHGFYFFPGILPDGEYAYAAIRSLLSRCFAK